MRVRYQSAAEVQDLVPEDAYTRYEITVYSPEWVVLLTETNDNLDYGYPTEPARWHDTYKGAGALEKCLRHTGYSRQGIGHKVIVTVDGKEV